MNKYKGLTKHGNFCSVKNMFLVNKNGLILRLIHYIEIPKGRENLFNQGKIGIQNCIATPKIIKYVNTTLKQITEIVKNMSFRSNVLLSFFKPLIHLIVSDIGAILIAPKIKVNQATTIILIIYKYT